MEDIAHEVKPEAVIHLAAVSSVDACEGDPVLAHSVNTIGARRVCKCFQESAETIVFASSAAVYGAGAMRTERSDLCGKEAGVYANTKRVAEMYVALAEKIPNRVVLRFSNVYGPGGHGVLNTWTTKLVAGQRVELRGNGKQTRDFVWVGDIAHAIRLVIEHPVPGAFNVSTGTNVSIVDALWRVYGTVHSWKNERNAVARLEELTAKVPARSADIQTSSLDPSEFKATFGWSPDTPLARGLAELADHAESTCVDK